MLTPNWLTWLCPYLDAYGCTARPTLKAQLSILITIDQKVVIGMSAKLI